MKRRMFVIVFWKKIILVSEHTNVVRDGVVHRREARRSLMRQSSRFLPPLRSAGASPTNASNFPAFESASICASETRAYLGEPRSIRLQLFGREPLDNFANCSGQFARVRHKTPIIQLYAERTTAVFGG